MLFRIPLLIVTAMSKLDKLAAKVFQAAPRPLLEAAVVAVTLRVRWIAQPDLSNTPRLLTSQVNPLFLIQ